MEQFLQRPTTFDGAVGTELYEKGHYINRPFEELNLSQAQDVVDVHQRYIKAGAEAITTNTFSITRPQLSRFDIADKQAELLRAAILLANKARAASPSVKIGLSIGPLGVLIEPLGPLGRDTAEEYFGEVATAACDVGQFDFYNLETFTNVDELTCAINGIRKVDSVRPILASLSAKSHQKRVLHAFAETIGKREDVQYLGLNCAVGPSNLLSSLKVLRPLVSKPIVVQPNAGIPRQLNGRYFYMSSPDYFAKYAKRFVEAGAQGIGGCCGTNPMHVKAVSSALKMMKSKADVVWNTSVTTAEQVEKSDPAAGDGIRSNVLKEIQAGRKVISIEVNPPKGTCLDDLLLGLAKISKTGVKFVNVPDGARASTRISSLHLSTLITNNKELNLNVIPHLTTRDRNLIALQSDLIGAYVNGSSDVLVITGDPPKLGSTKDATAVYDIDSIGLTYLVSCLNRGISPMGDSLGRGTGWGIGVAANPTASNMNLELSRWGYKYESGAHYAITQPIFDPDTFKKWQDSISRTYRPHIVGIWPFVSLKNAEFMANEVPGVYVPNWALEEMAKAGDNPEEAAKRGVAIAQRVIEQLTGHCEGFCISAPLGRIPVALEVIQ